MDPETKINNLGSGTANKTDFIRPNVRKSVKLYVMNKYRKPFLYLRNLAVCEELPDLLGHLGPHPSDVRHLFEGGDGLRIGADGGDGCDKNTRFYKGAFYHLTISVAEPVFFMAGSGKFIFSI